jgi:hypothetical protein
MRKDSLELTKGKERLSEIQADIDRLFVLRAILG